MASSSGYVVKVRGKRGVGDQEETLYLDLGRLILASDEEQGLSIVLEGEQRVSLRGEDAAWVREILDAMAQPRKSGPGQVLFGGRR